MNKENIFEHNKVSIETLISPVNKLANINTYNWCKFTISINLRFISFPIKYSMNEKVKRQAKERDITANIYAKLANLLDIVCIKLFEIK